MSLSRPTCTLNVDGTAYTGPEAALFAMDIELCLGEGHDQARMHCSSLSPLRAIQPDAACSISLGSVDAEVEVLSGPVGRVERQLTGVSLEVPAGTYLLSQWYGAQAYQDQSVAEIIGDLADRAGVAIGGMDAPLMVQIWHVTEQHSAWWHINRLARMGDFEVLCDQSGALSVRPVGSGGLSHTLRFGAEILSLQIAQHRDSGLSRKYAPAGAGSELGSDKWQICLREPVGEEPDGPATIVGAVRDRDTAEKMTEAAALRQARALFSGTTQIIGNAAIRPGDTVDLTEIPDQDSVSARVLRVRHRFDGTNGFTTTLQLGGLA